MVVIEADGRVIVSEDEDGERIVIDGREVTINDEVVHVSHEKRGNIIIYGNIESLLDVTGCNSSISVMGVVGGSLSVEQGDVLVGGDVDGDVSIREGNLELNGDVRKGNVEVTEGSVSCGTVGGDVRLGGGTITQTATSN
ncbi:MAG: hypothetical protein LBK50_02020 [Candidatus Nomurabacteria bacterium]|nr:hypothetical protein [Candidatus Nomurabacteria bacterium]